MTTRNREPNETRELEEDLKMILLSRKCSFFERVERANQAGPIRPTQLIVILGIIGSSIAVTYTLAFVILEYVVFDGNTQWENYYPAHHDHIIVDPELSVTGTNPLCNLSEREFSVYLSFLFFVTMIFTGIGSEVFVWQLFLQGTDFWTRNLEIYWRLAQMLFSIFVLTAVALSTQHNYLSVPMQVFFLYKFGFPETIMFVYSALYCPPRRTKSTTATKAIHHHDHDDDDEAVAMLLPRIAHLLNGVGGAIHHSAGNLAVAMFVTGAVPAHRAIVMNPLPLLMQHWFMLLKYYDYSSYAVVLLGLEAWYEWIALSTVETAYKIHYLGGVCILSMLIAHWAYLLAAGILLFVDDNDDMALDGQRNKWHFRWNARTRGEIKQNDTEKPSQMETFSLRQARVLPLTELNPSNSNHDDFRKMVQEDEARIDV